MAEKNPEPTWIETYIERPEPMKLVIIPGGVGYLSGDQWFDVTGKAWPGVPVQPVKVWMPMPKPV